MNELKRIRWQQRWSNLTKAFAQLKKGVAIESPSEIEVQGIIQSFEFTFELSWKTLKDYLESQGVNAGFPREVLKQAYHYDLLDDGEKWLQMLAKRNLLAHTYDEDLARKAYDLIVEEYFPQIAKLIDLFGRRTDEEQQK